MFGYVRVYSPQLKVWENELYKSIYCGLCRHGGKHTTRLTRFFLNYDFVALAVMRMAFSGEKAVIKKHFCPYCPKRKLMIEPNDSLFYTADAFVILSYYKLLDDKNDTKGIKKLISSIPPAFLSKEAQRAEKRRIGLAECFKGQLEMLSEKEKKNESCIDSVADCFAVLLGKTLSYELEGANERIAYEIGYHMGRYIYIIDALDDFKKDIEEHNYNPLISMYCDIKGLKDHMEIIISTLNASLNRVKSAVELIENVEYKGIIDNIVTDGCENVITRVVNDFSK